MAASKKIPSWKAKAWHHATGPSGTEYDLRIPSLTLLIQLDSVPERLRAIALKSAAHPASLRGVMADALKDQNDAEEKGTKSLEDAMADDSELKQAIGDVVDIQRHLIVESVKVDGQPLTLDDLADPDFPAPDAEWLGAVMMREIDVDARGVRLGIEPLDRWATFRHFHDCAEACSACAALQDELSTVDLGRV